MEDLRTRQKYHLMPRMPIFGGYEEPYDPGKAAEEAVDRIVRDVVDQMLAEAKGASQTVSDAPETTSPVATCQDETSPSRSDSPSK